MLKEITLFNYKLISVPTLKEGCEQIKKKDFILILLDLNLPDSLGKNTFEVVLDHAGNTPIVLVSGLQDVKLSISLIRKGAQDYISKQDLNSALLGKTIQFAIERKKLLSEIIEISDDLKHSNSYYQNRELRMIELKEEINALLLKAGQEKKYQV